MMKKTSQKFTLFLNFALIVIFCALFSLQAKAQFKSDLPSLGDAERGDLSPLAERKLGESVMVQIRRDPDYIDDGPTSEYLNSLGNKMLDKYPEARNENGNDYEFFAVRDASLNAFALPGGFIAVHTGLLIATQTESELASVMAHEIGHVAQRHIARMIGMEKQNWLYPLAGAAAAALAARNNPELAQAFISAGFGVAIQRQLNFSREIEREADRIGFRILGASGFDPSGMTVFFGRMQTASSAYPEIPSYLRTHPMTTERIADIQARISEMRYRQRIDSLAYFLIRARVRVLQDEHRQGLINAENFFKKELEQGSKTQKISSYYGMCMVALKRGEIEKAKSYLQQTKNAAKAAGYSTNNSIFTATEIDMLLKTKKYAEALKQSSSAMDRYPLSRGIRKQYATALINSGDYKKAERYLRDQLQLYRSDPALHSQLAWVYDKQNKKALMHMSLAESYALQGSLPAALQQLRMARLSPDATFYDHSIIDAREREWKALHQAQVKEKNKF